MKDRVARYRKRYIASRPKKPQESAKKERYIENTPVSYTEHTVTGPVAPPHAPHTAFPEGFHGVIRLHLNDEAPRIGCGERPLTVSVGPKRVRLLNHHTGDVGWIGRDVFERLAHKAIEQGRIAPRATGQSQ